MVLRSLSSSPVPLQTRAAVSGAGPLLHVPVALALTRGDRRWALLVLDGGSKLLPPLARVFRSPPAVPGSPDKRLAAFFGVIMGWEVLDQALFWFISSIHGSLSCSYSVTVRHTRDKGVLCHQGKYQWNPFVGLQHLNYREIVVVQLLLCFELTEHVIAGSVLTGRMHKPCLSSRSS